MITNKTYFNDNGIDKFVNQKGQKEWNFKI